MIAVSSVKLMLLQFISIHRVRIVNKTTLIFTCRLSKEKTYKGHFENTHWHNKFMWGDVKKGDVWTGWL